jgi:hypothetical protein
MTHDRPAVSPILAATNRLRWKLNVLLVLNVLNIEMYAYIGRRFV